MRAPVFERARQAVMDQMGWEDDRQSEETEGWFWDLAGDVAQAVVDELSEKANPGGGRIARWRMTCARPAASQGAPP